MIFPEYFDLSERVRLALSGQYGKNSAPNCCAVVQAVFVREVADLITEGGAEPMRPQRGFGHNQAHARHL
jgi:hypothetical protein